jgi:hypothetical protein
MERKMAKKKKASPKCESCRYFDAGTKTQGKCRACPPQVSGTRGAGVWPTVKPADWCGRFKPRKPAKK